MGKELVISSSRHETKLALLEDDQLVEVYFQRANEYSLAGSIHKGRVTRVLPGMQSAFVDIGLERDAFLYVSDFFEENEEYDKMGGDERPARPPRHEPPPPPPAPVIVEPPVVAAAPPVAEAPAPAEREEDDSRDRRGRRSRRRRSRGRGFPESKYASEIPATREEPEPVVEEAAAAEPSEEFAVLPGESLAKYRRPEGEGESEENGEPETVEPENGFAAEEVEAPASLDETTSSYEELYSEEPEAEPASALPDEIPDLPPSAPVAEAVKMGLIAGAESVEVEEVEAAELVIPAEIEEEEEEPPADSGAEPLEAEPVMEEDLAEPDSEMAPVEEPVGEVPPAEDVEPARMPVSLTATLRERGDRYMHHRVSRRMRRKMRGGGPAGAPPVEERPQREAPPMQEPEPREAHAPRSERERPPQPSITDLLREGQEIIVQIAKEPLGQKGARITSHIALPGRYVVYMPTVEHLGVSRKISTDEERQRLRRILQTYRAGVPGGYIVRTAGEGKTEEEIANDMRFLANLWQDMRRRAEHRKAPALIHHDLDLVQRTLRDQMAESFKSIWVDNEEVYESVLRFVERFQPQAVNRVKLYTRPTPIFDAFNITNELEKALRPKVWLKSGGYIVINQTEALVAIDVNTGKFVGKSNRLEDTIFKTNTEAVKEIVRQIRLRDLGGIIVVDFIDMDERKNRQKVMQVLEETMRADRAPNKILQFNDFGLVAITRKRVKQSLERTLCSPCPYCEGAGYVKSVATVIGEILQEAQKLASVIEGKEVMLRVNPEVAKALKSHENRYLEELEEILRRPVMVTGDHALHQEKFDLV